MLDEGGEMVADLGVAGGGHGAVGVYPCDVGVYPCDVGVSEGAEAEGEVEGVGIGIGAGDPRVAASFKQ